MRTIVSLCLMLTCCVFSSVTAQIEGTYTGNYRIITNYSDPLPTVADYPVQIVFTDSTYQFVQTTQDLCVPSGTFSILSTITFTQQDEGCITLNGDPVKNPQGTFTFTRTQDSLICTQLSGSTIKTFQLKREDITYHLEVSPAYIAGLANQTGLELPVYLVNTEDTVVGYQFWLQLSRPDIASFQLTFDTVGTLTSSWEFVNVSHLSGQPYEILVTAIADMPTPPEITPGILPQDGTMPLIKLSMDIQDVHDSVTDRAATIYVNDQFLDHFSFTDPSANSIGLITDTVPDTSWFVCTTWDQDVCLSWQQVPGPPADSIFVGEGYIHYLDTSIVHVRNSAVRAAYCGNVNAYDSQIDISDLLFLVDYMFTTVEGIEPVYYYAADMDGSGSVDIADLLYLVDYMFLSPPGPSPICQ